MKQIKYQDRANLLYGTVVDENKTTYDVSVTRVVKGNKKLGINRLKKENCTSL